MGEVLGMEERDIRKTETAYHAGSEGGREKEEKGRAVPKGCVFDGNEQLIQRWCGESLAPSQILEGRSEGIGGDLCSKRRWRYENGSRSQTKSHFCVTFFSCSPKLHSLHFRFPPHRAPFPSRPPPRFPFPLSTVKSARRYSPSHRIWPAPCSPSDRPDQTPDTHCARTCLPA